MPTWFLGPLRQTQQGYDFGFGGSGSSISGQVAADFNVSVIDDPDSMAALNKPLDPATIGYIINRAPEVRDAILFFFVREIYVENGQNSWDWYNNQPLQWFDRGNGSGPGLSIGDDKFFNFYHTMYSYIRHGLTVRVARDFVPSPDNTQTVALICFDKNITDTDPRPDHRIFRLEISAGDCDSEKLAHTEDVTSGITGKQSSSPDPTPSKPVNKQPSAAGEKSPSAAPTDVFSWQFTDYNGKNVRIVFRSISGIYKYIGEYVRLREKYRDQLHQIPNFYMFDPAIEGKNAIENPMYITHDQSGCMTNLSYSFDGTATNWCVPSGAYNTKFMLSILRDLFKLLTKPSNQPATATVRQTG
jgi:hypothetical protein